MLETESTNCGENAQFALQAIVKHGLTIERIILVQDATMQRRSAASFARVWQDAGRDLRIANYPTFTPVVSVHDGKLSFASDEGNAGWPIERFISLLLGEIPRLRDDERGYGPRGRGFIVHVAVPDEVLGAQERLATAFPDLMR